MSTIQSATALSSAYSALSARGRAAQAASAPQSAPATVRPSDTVTLSQAAKDRLAGKDAQTYDFTSAKPGEMLATVNGLIKSGRMTLDESSTLLCFVPDSLTQVQQNGKTVSPNSGMDVFSGLQSLIAYNKAHHNDAGVVYAQKALAAITRLQGTPVVPG